MCGPRSRETYADDCIILGYLVGSAVRIVKSKISSAKMNQNLRGYGLVEIQPDGVTVDLLVAPAGYRNWKTIRGRYLRCVLHRPVAGDLRILVQTVIDLDAWNALKPLVGNSGVPVVLQFSIVRTWN